MRTRTKEEGNGFAKFTIWNNSLSLTKKKKKKQPMEVTKKWLSSVLFSGLSSINQMVKTLQKK